MAEDSRIDLRDRREANWSWFQNELLQVFVRLIGSEAALLYIALCYLVEEQERDRLKEISLRTIGKYSSLGVGTVHKYLPWLEAVGMVSRVETEPGRPARYVLASLQRLATLGTAELAKRLESVREWNTSKEGKAYKASLERGTVEARKQPGRADAGRAEVEAAALEVNAPEGSGEGTVREMNTAATSGRGAEVFGKTGGSVRETGGMRSANGGVAFGSTSPLIKEERQTEEEKNPLTPASGGSGLILPFEARRRGEDGYATCLPIAARWAMARIGDTNSRHESTVAAQLHLFCEQQASTVEESATAMVAAWTEYLAAVGEGSMRFGPYGAPKFIGQGIWRDRNRWGWKPEILERAREREQFTYKPDPAKKAAARAATLERWTQWIAETVATLVAAGDSVTADAILGNEALCAMTLPVDQADEELQRIENEMCERLWATAAGESIERWRKLACERLEPYRGKIARAVWDEQMRKAMLMALMEEKGLPRLSLFYSGFLTS